MSNSEVLPAAVAPPAALRMLGALHRGALVLTRLAAWFGVALLIVAMLVTSADILMRRSIDISVPGTIDLTQLFVMGAAFLAIPYAFMVRGHVAVAVLQEMLPRRLRAATDALAMLLALGLCGGFTWFGWLQARLQLEYGDVSQTIGVPIVWYWAPLLTGMALACLACLLLLAGYLYTLATGRSLALPAGPGEGA